MRTILIAAAAAALLLPGAAFAQSTGPQDVVPSSEHQNSSHANAPGNSGEPGYSTGGPRATPTSDTRKRRLRAMHSSNPNSTMSGPNETNSSEPTDQTSSQSPQ